MHSAMHFAIGLWTGILIGLPRVIRALRRADHLSDSLGRLIVMSSFTAVFAIIPNIFRQLGLPESVCSSGFMNIFIFHPLFDKLHSGGMLKGEAAIAAAFVLLYGTILAAIRRAQKNAV